MGKFENEQSDFVSKVSVACKFHRVNVALFSLPSRIHLHLTQLCGQTKYHIMTKLDKEWEALKQKHGHTGLFHLTKCALE